MTDSPAPLATSSTPDASQRPLGSVIASVGDGLARGDAGQQLGLLLGGGPVHDRARGEHDRGEERGAQQRGAHLLEHDPELDPREALPPVLLGDVQALEPELVRHLRPDGGVVPVVGLHQAADLGRRRLRLQEATHGVSELLLLLGEREDQPLWCTF